MEEDTFLIEEGANLEERVENSPQLGVDGQEIVNQTVVEVELDLDLANEEFEATLQPEVRPDDEAEVLQQRQPLFAIENS